MYNTILLYLKKYEKIIKYTLIGFSGVILDFFLYSLLLYFQIVDYQTANIIGISSGILNNFTLNKIFNFQVKEKIFMRFLSFVFVGILGMLISSFLLRLFIETYGLNQFVAKFYTLFFVLFFQYTLNKYISFGRIFGR